MLNEAVTLHRKPRPMKRRTIMPTEIIVALSAASLVNGSPDTSLVKIKRYKNSAEKRAALLDRQNRHNERKHDGRIPFGVAPDFERLYKMACGTLAEAERTGRHDNVTRTIEHVGLARLRAGDKAALHEVGTAYLDGLADYWLET